MNIYWFGIFIGILIGVAIAAFYAITCALMKSEEDWINEWRDGK